MASGPQKIAWCFPSRPTAIWGLVSYTLCIWETVWREALSARLIAASWRATTCAKRKDFSAYLSKSVTLTDVYDFCTSQERSSMLGRPQAPRRISPQRSAPRLIRHRSWGKNKTFHRSFAPNAWRKSKCHCKWSKCGDRKYVEMSSFFIICMYLCHNKTWPCLHIHLRSSHSPQSTAASSIRWTPLSCLSPSLCLVRSSALILAPKVVIIQSFTF